MSLYELINGYEENISAPDLSPFSTELVEHLTGDILEQQNTLVERMIAAAKSVGHPHNHPLKDVGCTQYTQQLHTELKEAVTSYESVLTVLCDACDDLTTSIHFAFPNRYSDLEKTVFNIKRTCRMVRVFHALGLLLKIFLNILTLLEKWQNSTFK
jgi:hypothetical protein